MAYIHEINAREHDRIMQLAKEYIPDNPQVLADVNSHADKLDLWYTRRWRKMYPEHPPCQWDVATSVQLAEIFSGYLLWLCTKAIPYNPSGKVRSTTLRSWAMALLHLAGHNILGVKSSGRQQSVVYGIYPDKSDSLWNLLLRSIVPLLIGSLGLPCHSQPKDFYGPDELMLSCRVIDMRMIAARLGHRASLLQFKAINQFLLATGNRSDIAAFTGRRVSGNQFKYTEENKLVIHQVKRHCYEIEVDIEYLKGYSRGDHGWVEYKQRIPPVNKAGNVQLEFACSIIPLLIHRRVLYCCRRGGDVVFTDIDKFLEANDATFLVKNTRLPLFRVYNDQGLATDSVLNHSSFSELLRSVNLECNLSSARGYKTAAVRAVLRTMDAGSVDHADFIATDEQRQAALDADDEYQRLRAELETQCKKLDKGDVGDSEHDDSQVFKVRDKMTRRRQHLYRELSSSLRRNTEAAVREEVHERHATVAEVTEARAALDSMRDGLPLLLETEVPSSLKEDCTNHWPSGAAIDDDLLDDDITAYFESASDSSHTPLPSWLGGVYDPPQFDVGQPPMTQKEALKLARRGSHAADFGAFDEDEDEEYDEEEAGNADVDLTIERRVQLMKMTWEVLHAREELNKLMRFVERFGYCPLCPMHKVGFVMFRATQSGSTMIPGISTTGMFPNDLSLATHMRACHKDVFDKMNSGEPFRPQPLSDYSIPDLSQAEIDTLARVYNATTVPVNQSVGFGLDQLDDYLRMQNEFDEWYFQRGGF